MSANRRAGNQQPRIDPTRAARLQRDAGIERARTITKGLAFGSVAAVACAGLYLSQALPGHAASSTGTAGTTGTAGAATPAAPAAVAPSDDNSQSPAYSTPAAPAYSAPAAPAYTPAPAYRQAPVVSSGSS